jgi:plastocyanin
MHRTTVRFRFVGVVLAVSLLLAACGAGDGEGSDDAGGDTGGTTTSTVTLVDNAFEPSDPVVAAGDVEVVNDGSNAHTFTVEGQDVDVEVQPGETATASVDVEPGSYTLFCQFHRSAGMETTLTVE